MEKTLVWSPVDDYEDGLTKVELNLPSVCDLMHDEDESNGILAIHKECFTGEIHSTRSANDPNQGWGDKEDAEYYLEDTSGEDQGPIKRVSYKKITRPLSL